MALRLIVRIAKPYAEWMLNMTRKGYGVNEILYSMANKCLPNLFPVPEERHRKDLFVGWTQVIAMWAAVFAIIYAVNSAPALQCEEICLIQQNAMGQAHIDWIVRNWNGSINFSERGIFLGFMNATGAVNYSDWNNHSFLKEH